MAAQVERKYACAELVSFRFFGWNRCFQHVGRAQTYIAKMQAALPV